MAAFCSTSRTVVPAALRAPILSAICATISGASPREGSSSSSRRGELISARPMANICCSPPERYPAWLPRRSASSGNPSRTSLVVAATLRRTRTVTAPARRFSSTVSSAKIRRPSMTCAMPRRTRAVAEARPTGAPSNSTSPAVMRPSWNDSSPVRARSRVVLPAPLAPSRATTAPAPPAATRVRLSFALWAGAAR